MTHETNVCKVFVKARILIEIAHLLVKAGYDEKEVQRTLIQPLIDAADKRLKGKKNDYQFE